METNNILFALGLTLFAGLSTGIGSAMSLVSKKFSPKFLAISLGFSAGVIIYVSLVDIFQKAKVALVDSFGAKQGYLFTVLAFFGGIALIAIIDKLIHWIVLWNFAIRFSAARKSCSKCQSMLVYRPIP
jgi:ZIP family zinc transporter